MFRVNVRVPLDRGGASTDPSHQLLSAGKGELFGMDVKVCAECPVVP